MKLLWVKSGGLLPADTGGRKRTLSMLRAMAGEGHHIDYVALQPHGVPVSEEEKRDPYAQKKVWVPWHESAKKSPRFFGELLMNQVASSRPYALDKYASRAWRTAVREMAEGADLVVCDFLTPALNFRGWKAPCPTVLFQHNVESQIWKRLAGNATNQLVKTYLSCQFRRMLRWEQLLSEQFTGVISVSPDDSDFFRRQYGLKNILGDVPTGVDLDFFRMREPAAEGRADGLVVGFLGSMDWAPNIEGVDWFLDRVLPVLQTARSGVTFKIIGRNPPHRLVERASQDPSIEVTGTVDDVRPFVHDCDVLAVPLLSGGGTRIKIFEAMAMGIPVVSTTIGAEGLPVFHGEHLLLADEAESFQDAVVALLRDREQAVRIAESARSLVATKFGWNGAARVFVDLCSQLIN